MHKFNKAPLPFMGQKRNWLKHIHKLDFKHYTVVDLFGGSGILSHEIKRNNPSATVIWNDYDNYQERLLHIEETERLREKLYAMNPQLNKNEKIDDVYKAQIIELLKACDYVDMLTLSTWFLFTGNYTRTIEEFSKKQLYFNIPKSPLNGDSYLKGVKRVSCDYKELINHYKKVKNVIYIADPPYIMTNQQGYKKNRDGSFFRLKNAIELIKSIHTQKALLFSSTKSETDDLLELFCEHSNYQRVAQTASVCEGKRYTELMYLFNW